MGKGATMPIRAIDQPKGADVGISQRIQGHLVTGAMLGRRTVDNDNHFEIGKRLGENRRNGLSEQGRTVPSRNNYRKEHCSIAASVSRRSVDMRIHMHLLAGWNATEFQ